MLENKTSSSRGVWKVVKPLFYRRSLANWLPIALVIIVLSLSFFYGWVADDSKPRSGNGWGDQKSYSITVNKFANGNALKSDDLHFTIGYALVGSVGRVFSKTDPFMAPSLIILLSSGILCFLAARRLFGTSWALAFVGLLFYWDGFGRTFNFASELFVVPWNNQLLFLLMSYYLWLFVTQVKKEPSWKLVLFSSTLSGFTFLTREETILFSLPVMTLYLWLTKAGVRKLLASYVIIMGFFLPQVIAKMMVVGSAITSGRSEGYSKIGSYYFRLDLLVRNTWETLINSKHYQVPSFERSALLQAAPWLWLSPIGLCIVLISERYSKGLKIFILASLGLIAFYLSGANMSASKLAFHCLRYITPGFIALNLGVIIVAREAALFIKDPKKKNKLKKLQKWYIRYLARIVENLPVMVPVALAAFSTTAVMLLLLGALTNALVWPLGLLVASMAIWLVHSRHKKIGRPGSIGEQRIYDLLVLVGVILWVVFNVYYTAQNVTVYRDPGIYTVTGAELIDHDTLNILVPSDFGENKILHPASAGFAPDLLRPGYLIAQGSHLLPVLLGLVGRVSGVNAMLHFTPVLGGGALLAFYGFTRLIARPKWAAIVTGVFAVTLPLIYFSRDTYTEPLSILFAFGALSALWAAQKTRSHALWFLAGLTAGAGALTRPDGYVLAIGLAGFVIVFLALSAKRDQRERLIQSALLAAGVAITNILGWLDITQLSSAYYKSSTGAQVRNQLYIIAGVALMGLIVVPILWRSQLLKRIDDLTKKWRAPAIGIAIVLVAGFLASRPLWQVARRSEPLPILQGLQTAANQPVDLYRTYHEQTVNWLLWYIGPVVAVLGLAGAVLLAMQAMRRKDLLFVTGLIVIVGTSAMILYQPGIAPDQIWASRRLLPITIPGTIAFSAVGMQLLEKRLHGKVKSIVLTVVAASLFVWPLFITWPFITERSHVPQLSQMNTVCQRLPDNAAVMWAGPSAYNMAQAIDTFCDVPTTRLVRFDANELKKVAGHLRSQGKLPVIGVVAGEELVLPASTQLTVVHTVSYKTMALVLDHPPRDMITQTRTILLGTVGHDGKIQGYE